VSANNRGFLDGFSLFTCRLRFKIGLLAVCFDKGQFRRVKIFDYCQNTFMPSSAAEQKGARSNHEPVEKDCAIHHWVGEDQNAALKRCTNEKHRARTSATDEQRTSLNLASCVVLQEKVSIDGVVGNLARCFKLTNSIYLTPEPQVFRPLRKPLIYLRIIARCCNRHDKGEYNQRQQSIGDIYSYFHLSPHGG
jgi:hypothetical protein